MKYATIENGIVTNTIEAEADYAASIGAVPAANAGIGWHFDGSTYTAPAPVPPAVPQSVTMRQARLALLGAGLLSGVSAAIAGLSEPTKSAAQIEWEYASEVQRNSGLVPEMASALGLTPAQIDALFIAAIQL